MRAILTFSARLWLLAAGAFLILFTCQARGDEAPRPAVRAHDLQHWMHLIRSSAAPEHDGTCNVASMRVAGVRCHIWVDRVNIILWLVLFEDRAATSPYLIMFVRNEVETIAWCKEGRCS